MDKKLKSILKSQIESYLQKTTHVSDAKIIKWGKIINTDFCAKITSFAIKNYETIKDKINWNRFVTNLKRNSNEKYDMNSFTLITLMLELNMFTPLEQTTEVMSSIYCDRALEITGELEEANDNNCKLNEMKKEKDKDSEQ